MRKLAYVIILILMSGCITPASLTRTEVEVIDDPFSATIDYLGISSGSHTEGGLFDATTYRHFLRSWKDRESGDVSHQLYVVIEYGGNWRFYERTTMVGGDTVEVLVIDRDVISCMTSCSYSEIIGIMIPEQILEVRADLPLKIYSKSGHQIETVLTSDQIKKQLSTIYTSEVI